MLTHYQGRRKDVVPMQISLDREAAEILWERCPAGTKARGRYVSRLVLEERVRQEERARLTQETAYANR